MADMKEQLKVIKAIETYYKRKANYFAFKQNLFDRRKVTIEVKFK